MSDLIERLRNCIDGRCETNTDIFRGMLTEAANRIQVLEAAFDDRVRVIKMQIEDKRALQAKVEQLEGALRRIATRDYNETAQAFAEQALKGDT